VRFLISGIFKGGWVHLTVRTVNTARQLMLTGVYAVLPADREQDWAAYTGCREDL